MSNPQELSIPTDWLQPNGLALPDDLRDNDWEHIGWAFLYLDGVSQWAIGDWYNVGVERYGVKKVVACLEDLKRRFPYLHLDKLKLKTIRNYASLCKTFPLHSRTWEHLQFWHYYKVQGYEPDERDGHLEHANTMEMTIGQFEAYLREQDSNRGNGKDREQTQEELTRDNGHLKEHVKMLEETVDLYREQTREKDAIIEQLEKRLTDDPLFPVDEAYDRDQSPATCDRCYGPLVCAAGCREE